MSFETQKAALIKWLELGSGLPVGKVIWTDQNMPRPIRPYIAVNMTGFKTINREYVGLPDVNGKGKVIAHKEFVLTMQCFAENAGITDPLEVLLRVQDSLNKNKHIEALRAEGIVFIRVLFGPDCTSIKIDAMSEQRGGMDLHFRMPWTTEDESQGLIDATSIESLTLDINGNTIMARTLNIGTPYAPPETSLSDYEFISIDTLLETIKVQSGVTIYDLVYNPATVVTINAAPVVITDLQAGDVLDIVYFEYLGAHTLKTVTAIRT